MDLKELSAEEFYNILKNHDWFYMMSDDHRVYTAGRSNEARISGIAQTTTGTLKQMYVDFCRYYNVGNVQNNTRGEMPKLEDYV